MMPGRNAWAAGRMDIKKLKAFSVVAEFGGFSRAAGVLNVAQPVLSRQVRALEEELGVQLVYRNGRGIVAAEPAFFATLTHGCVGCYRFRVWLQIWSALFCWSIPSWVWVML